MSSVFEQSGVWHLRNTVFYNPYVFRDIYIYSILHTLYCDIKACIVIHVHKYVL